DLVHSERSCEGPRRTATTSRGWVRTRPSRCPFAAPRRLQGRLEMVRSCGSVFAVLGTAVLTVACSSSHAAPAAGAKAGAQAQTRHDPLTTHRAAESRPAPATGSAAAPVARTTAPRSTPAVAQSRAVLAPTPSFAAPAPAPVAAKPATAAIRAINTTCPVLIGSPVDPTITTRWQN